MRWLNKTTEAELFGGLVLLILLFGCSSPENNSGEEPATDTSTYHVPGNSAPVKNAARVDTVQIINLKFQPEELQIQKGDTVVWINSDLVVHCVTEAHNMDWTSHQIPSGASWKKAFTQSSDYYCMIHQVMKGKIIVTDPSAAP